MIAIIEAYKSGLLSINNLAPNVLAGVIVGVVSIPLAMAFAISSGLNPQQGLYTAIVAGLAVALFGGTRTQIAGPTGAFIVILASITTKYGVNGLQVATLLAGFILLFMGIMRLGNVIKFIPDPVIVGFTSGIGFIIFIGEWKDFLGLSVQLRLDDRLHVKLYALVKALPTVNLPTLALASLSLFLILITPKIVKRIPGPLVAMIGATLIQTFFSFKGVETLGSAFGEISQQLPQFRVPTVPFTHLLDLIGPAFTIALLGAIESLLSATAADGMANTRHHSNQELIGQGLANILTPLFGGFAATGAIARTATNIRNGGNSPIAAMVHSIFLLLTILLLAPLAGYVPLCALAAILIVVAYNMSDIPHFISMLKHAPRYDVVVLIITFLLTIFTNLVVAVNIGIIFAMLFFVRRMSQLVHVEEQTSGTLLPELASHEMTVPENTLIYSIQGPFFFAAAEKIEHALAVVHADPKNIVFRLRDVPFMDITGLETFNEVINQYHKRGVKIYLCEANARVTRKLMDIGGLTLIENHHIYNSLVEALKVIKEKA